MSETEPLQENAVAAPESTPAFDPPVYAARAGAERQREGLPAGYRMRADAHYVDQLSAPRSPRRGEPAKSEPRMPFDLDRFHAQLAEDLATIQGAATLLASEPTAVARQVSLDLIRHQAWRAAWLLRARGILDGSATARPKSRRLGALLTQWRDALMPECRLIQVGLDVQANDWAAMVDVDESWLMTGVTGGLLATLGLVGQPDWAVVRLSATEHEGQLRRIDITQEEISADEDTRRRFFDLSWTSRPGGWTAALAAATARAVAVAHGGEATLEPTGRRGTRLTVTFGRP